MIYDKPLNGSRKYLILMNLTLLFIFIQPIFDLLSFLYIREYITIGISTYVKPLIIGLVNLALVFIFKKQFLKCAVTYVGFIVLTVVHVFLLYRMLVETAVILHEIRFMINLLYMLICYHSVRILYEEAPNKNKFAEYLKTTLFSTFGLYVLLYLLAFITGTSGRTYEYADALKQGYKGWMDSGQIFGHAFCICLPFIICFLLNNKMENKFLNFLTKLLVAIPILVLCMIGTKVTFYIPLFVLGIQVVLELFFTIKNKEIKRLFNLAICVICIATCILVYPMTPTKQNIDINNSVVSVKFEIEEIEELTKKDKEKYNAETKPNNTSQTDNNDVSIKEDMVEYEKNAKWTDASLSKLEQMYINGDLHPSDLRNKQMYYNLEKFKLADLKYKLFGLGYINQSDLAIERDILCVLFGFGIMGFILIFIKPIWLWFKSCFSILKHLLKTDIMTLCLFEGFSMFFFISWFAGYTIIYTNFSIFLVIIMTLLNHSIKRTEIKENFEKTSK